MEKEGMKGYKITSIVLLFVNSIGALAGGAGFILDPSGINQMPLKVLEHTPFKDFFIPGIILFTVNGLFGLVVLGMILFKHRKYPFYIIVQAILLGGWILIQVIMLREVNFLHILFISIAVVLFIMGLLLKSQKQIHDI